MHFELEGAIAVSLILSGRILARVSAALVGHRGKALEREWRPGLQMVALVESLDRERGARARALLLVAGEVLVGLPWRMMFGSARVLGALGLGGGYDQLT